MGIDGGNDKDWEAKACKIQLIKRKGKVKALDEEVHSMYCSFTLCSLPLKCFLMSFCFDYHLFYAEKHLFGNNF